MILDDLHFLAHCSLDGLLKLCAPCPYCCVIVAGQGRLTVSLLAPMVSQFFWHRCRFQIGYRHVTNMRLFRHYPAPPPQVAHLCLLACVSVGLCVFVCLGACACACACACVCACVCAFVGAILRPYGLPFPPAPLPVPDWIPACDSRRGRGRERERERESEGQTLTSRAFNCKSRHCI